MRLERKRASRHRCGHGLCGPPRARAVRPAETSGLEWARHLRERCSTLLTLSALFVRLLPVGLPRLPKQPTQPPNRRATSAATFASTAPLSSLVLIIAPTLLLPAARRLSPLRSRRSRRRLQLLRRPLRRPAAREPSLARRGRVAINPSNRPAKWLARVGTKRGETKHGDRRSGRGCPGAGGAVDKL